MYLEDNQVIVFNGRSSVNPKQFSVTGITNMKFYPVDLPDYDFHLEFYHSKTQSTIHDNTPELWQTWLETKKGTDPLGANLRPEFKNLIVTQDEVWQPNNYHRKGVFNHRWGEQHVSFGVESHTSVSGVADEVFLYIKLKNYRPEPLDLTLIPVQKLLRRDSTLIQRDGPFRVSVGDTQITIASDIQEVDTYGFRISLSGFEVRNYCLVIKVALGGENVYPVFQPDAGERFHQANQHTRERLEAFGSRLPHVYTQHSGINELYKRCALTVAECKWERDNFIIKPFWASGTWPISMIWDQYFSGDVLTMVDPHSVKETIKLTLRECRMKQSWLFWHGPVGNIVYIQDPFAIQSMLEAYIKYTGNFAVLNEVTGGKSVYEWMKLWALEINNNYTRQDGLIDVGPKSEQLIEIRTYGYNGVVPVVSFLASDFYIRMHQWANEVGDYEHPPYLRWSEKILKAVQHLWNDEVGWFEIERYNGIREIIWSYHLYELLQSKNVSPYQTQRLIQHIKDGEFLAPYGMYSISKRDTMHWDRIDGDWGGGGQYAGMPLRIASNLFKLGYSHQAFEILKRFARYVDHFPYIPQNPWSDKLFQDQSSMPLQISAGAGVEVILSGIFGLLPQLNGSLLISPYFDEELGPSELKGYRYRGYTYDVSLFEDFYTVRKDGQIVSHSKYGDIVLFHPGDGDN